MHKNFFTFKADNHYDLGRQMGTKFKDEAQKTLAENNNADFEKRIEMSAKMLKLTEPLFPEYVEEVRGYADGAGIEFLKMWTLAIEDDADIESDDARCTTIITNSGKLLAHSEDHFGEVENDVCILKKTLGELTTLEIYYYNTLGGVSVGVNSNGFASSFNTLLDTPRQIGIPKCIPARKFLETKDPVVDYEKIKSLRLADGYNHNIIDMKGKITNVELSTNETNISFPTSPFSHTNHCLFLKNKEEFEDVTGSFPRLTEAQGTPARATVEEIRKILNDNSLGDELSISNKRTVARMIVDLENLACYIWLLREKNRGWVKYPIDFITLPVAQSLLRPILRLFRI